MKTNIVFLLLIFAAGQTPTAAAQSPGIFTAAGNMTTPRFFHTATLLGDGRVLIAGGNSIDARTGDFKNESSAELYDPRTGRFTATGSMTMLRTLYTATLLPDGRVLIAGGAGGGVAALSSAELYDPRTGTFSSTGEMSTPRIGHTATLLNSGKVLIAAGGYPGQGYCCFPAGAELYDPDTGRFTVTGAMTSPWADTATLLPNGKVLITKGHTDAEPSVSWAELYDPSTAEFTATGYATANHTGPTATLLMNGKVLVAGGDLYDGDGGSSVAELYDPATGVFSRTGDMAIGREQDTATLLPDGSVLFAGGHLVFDLAVSAEIYDPIQGAFTRTANMPTAHEEHTATLLGDGTVLVAGGFAPWPLLTSNAEIYHPAVLVPAPVLFSLSGNGKGQGAIWRSATGLIASPQNPTVAGEILSMYTTSLPEGGVIPPQVAIGGRLADILFFGDAPAYPGYFQVNFRVPAGIVPGSAVSVRLRYIERLSNEVTIGVQ